MIGFSIKQYDFSEAGKVNVANEKRGRDWPVVYLIHNDKELYIVETQNAYDRMEQHLGINYQVYECDYTLNGLCEEVKKIC